jgi:hypothetical protein
MTEQELKGTPGQIKVEDDGSIVGKHLRRWR